MADERLELAVNVPATMIVKYCDLVPSKHPEKYPAQVKFKGAVNGQASVLYLDTPDVLRCLFAAGLIDDIPPHADQQTIPSKGDAVKLKSNELTFLRAQKPKEKKIALSINGATADMVREKPASAPAPAAAEGQQQTAPTNGATTVAAREKQSAAYKAITKFVLDDIVPMYRAKADELKDPRLALTGTDVKEIVATISINLNSRNGH